MVPPHDKPPFQAVSSATPNSSTLGLPLSITSMASVTTAPSTQPPDTEPRKLPSLSMTRLDPTGRGAEPHVSTTVASATSRPSRRQSSAALRISSSRASMSKSPVFRYVKENIETAAREANGIGRSPDGAQRNPGAALPYRSGGPGLRCAPSGLLYIQRLGPPRSAGCVERYLLDPSFGL